MEMQNCPNCGKKLKIIQWGDNKGNLSCPKGKTGKERKNGCGYQNLKNRKAKEIQW